MSFIALFRIGVDVIRCCARPFCGRVWSIRASWTGKVTVSRSGRAIDRLAPGSPNRRLSLIRLRSFHPRLSETYAGPPLIRIFSPCVAKLFESSVESVVQRVSLSLVGDAGKEDAYPEHRESVSANTPGKVPCIPSCSDERWRYANIPSQVRETC